VSQYSLPQLLESLHDSVQQELARARETFHHNGTMGDASEYLPQRYCAARAHVVDSKGSVSDQIDVVIFDRQYSPFIFKLDEHSFVLRDNLASGLVDIGCIASHGYFSFDAKSKKYDCVTAPRAATAFLFKLISKLLPPRAPAARRKQS
jgi:hypothetical protein